MKRIYLSLPIKNTGYTTKERMKYAEMGGRCMIEFAVAKIYGKEIFE